MLCVVAEERYLVGVLVGISYRDILARAPRVLRGKARFKSSRHFRRSNRKLSMLSTRAIARAFDTRQVQTRAFDTLRNMRESYEIVEGISRALDEV